MDTFRGFGRALSLLLLTLALQLHCGGSTATAAPPGASIPNQATIAFSVGGVPQPPVASNIVILKVRSPATIEFLAYAPTLPGAEAVPVPGTDYQSGALFTPIPAPPETALQPMPLTPAELFHAGNPFYLRLTDLDQNTDPATVQTVLVTVTCTETGDSEVLRLTESGPDTGIFTGYLPSSASGAAVPDGVLIVAPDNHITASYTDSADGTDSTVDAALVDPFGYVFDSATGAPVDGATVTLIDLATGLPATTIVGDNGAPGFPASIVTGSAFSFGGLAYSNPAGGFRFPFVPPGNYRLDVAPPSGYLVPSTISDATLQTRSWWPGSGYVLATGARGEAFAINPGPAIRIDIPADPLASYLWMEKAVSDQVAATGDFLRYTLTLENGNLLAAAPGLSISDQLPPGFRYQAGSTRIDGSKAADPAISADGRTLTFTLGDLAPGGRAEVKYVVEVAAGAKPGKAVNRAQAFDANGIASNQARVTVTVRDEFFRNATFLLGRVLTGSCSQADTEMKGLPGVRLYLEDGSYVVTDPEGRYHFEGVEPGVHVVQVDLATLPAGYEMVPCEQTSQFAGRSFSQFVDLQGGTLWQVNFYAAPLPPPSGEVTLQLFSELQNEVATFRVVAKASAVPADNLRVTLMLPGEAEFVPGSASLDGQKLADPLVLGGAVNLRAAHLEAGQRLEFVLQARLDTGAGGGELPAKALLTFDTPSARNQRTPLAENRFRLESGAQHPSEEIRLHPHFPTFVAELQPTDLTMLEELGERLASQKIVRVDIVGHTDNQEIAGRSRHIFADNQALSEGRAKSVADFLRQRLALAENTITLRGLGDTMPVAGNESEAGRALNRRVELFVLTEGVSTPARVELTQPASPIQAAPTRGVAAAEAQAVTLKRLPPPAERPPKLDQQWLAAAPLERRIAWPVAGYAPEIPDTAIVVQYQRGEQVALRLNDAPVPSLNFDETRLIPNSDMLVASWAGVDLRNGLNRIEAIVSDGSGREVARLQRDLWFITHAEKLEYRAEQSVLVADGLTAPTFAIRLTDREGHPLHPDRQLQFSVSSPYLPLRDGADPTLEQAATGGTFVTGADGLAYLQLQPTTQAGEVVVTVMLPGGAQEIRAWLKPAPREWILVGFAEGTVGYNTLSGNMVSADSAGVDEHGYTDGQVKFFAKGAVKGEWLLTLAYDSDKPDLDGDSLQQIIDPDSYYPLYGDGTQQGYEAASARDIYVKLERDQFYALFGDMQTGLTQTVLSQYSRSMNGFKSELQGERFAYTLFAADTKQAFVKDELRGDGTSGRYTLSQQSLVINSEEVVVETRDRFHNELVVKEVRLSRHIDYDIDYDAGTLFFKRPVASKDENFNPNFIVVRYETQDASSANLNYGGRAAVKLQDGRVEVGASLVHEKSGVAKGDLYGADITVKLTAQTSLRAEVAATDVRETADERKGDAYLAEVEHHGERLDGRTWFRQQDPDFGLGQQSGGTGGMRTFGAEGAYRLDPRWSLAGEAYHEDNLGTDAKRDVGSLEALYRAERYGLSAGMREARDRFENGDKQTSRQMLLGGDWSTPDRKLTLRTTHEQSLGGSNDNGDYPTRTMLGADYLLSERITLFAEQEFTWGGREDTQGTRAGIKAAPWQGGEVRTTLERQTAEHSERVFALFGLGQSWQVSKEWSIDLSIDRSQTIKHAETTERVNDDAPPASGGDDEFTAVSVGAARRVETWSWWNRLEVRQGESEDKVGISSGLVGELRDGVAASARLMAFISDSANGRKSDEEELRLGLAYRPNQSRWIILERLDLSLLNEDGNGSENDSMRIVNHIHANYRANRQWQASVYYGLKYVRERFDGDRYDGYTDMIAVETRYNVTSKWDIGLHAAMLHSWNSGQLDYSLGASVGYLVMTNAWVSAGYNVAGFEDQDFSSANYTAQGPFMRLRMKFDQQSVRDAAAWLNR